MEQCFYGGKIFFKNQDTDYHLNEESYVVGIFYTTEFDEKRC